MVAAVRELEKAQAYQGKINFNIIPNTQEGFKEEVASFDIGNHGLVAFDPDGKVAEKIAGHSFGKSEITEVAKKVLAQ